MFKSALLCLALLCLAQAKPDKNPSNSNEQNVPPGTPVMPDYNVAGGILRNVDEQGDEISFQLAKKYFWIINRLKSVESSLGGLGDKAMDAMPKVDDADFEEINVALQQITAELMNDVQGRVVLVQDALTDARHMQENRIDDLKAAVDETLSVNRQETMKAIWKQQKRVKKEIEKKAEAVSDALEDTSNMISNAVEEVEIRVPGLIDEAQEAVINQIDEVAIRLEDESIAPAVDAVNQIVGSSGVDILEEVAGLQDAIDAKIAEQNGASLAEIEELQSNAARANSRLRSKVRKSIEESSKAISDRVEASSGGMDDDMQNLSDALVAEVSNRLKNKIRAVKTSLRDFINERIGPIHEGVAYLTERAYRNSMAIKFSKSLLKKIVSGDCYHNKRIDLGESEYDLPDEIRKITLLGF